MIPPVRRRTLRELVLVAFVAAMMLIPWAGIFHSVNGYEFVDRSRYVDYFLFQRLIFEYRTFDSLLGRASFELLWHQGMAWLVRDLGVPIAYLFAAISLSLLFVFGRIVLMHAGAPALLLLVNPLVVDLAFSQLRLALAMAVLGAAYLLKDRSKVLPLALTALTPFLHTASVIFIAIYLMPFLATWVTRRYRQGWLFDLAMLLTLGALVSLAIGPLREAILGFIGDRRVDYTDAGSSLLYSAFWIALVVPIAVFGRRLIVHDYVRVTVVVLAVVAINLLHGGYSTRFLAATFPFIVCSVMALPWQAKVPVLFAFVAYATFQWLYWLRILGG